MKEWLAGLLLLVSSSTALAAGREVRLHEWPAVGMLTRLSPDAIHAAVKAGATERKWQVTSERPGYIELQITPRSHALSVSVSYDTNQYQVRYVASENLNFREERGQRYLHPSAISWVDNLISAINIQLLRAVPLE